MFLQLALGLGLPLLLSAHHWHPAGGLQASGSGTESQLVMPSVAHLQHQAAPHVVLARELVRGVAASVRRAAAAADGLVWAVLHSSSGPVARTLVAWWLLSLGWLLAAELTGLRLIL